MPGVCPRCSKNVYFAEEKVALGKSWHKLCYACAECKKLLDSGNAAEHEGEVYCSSCHRKSFGPKGYGFGLGAGSLSMDSGKGSASKPTKDYQADAYIAPTKKRGEGLPKIGGADVCPRCDKNVYLAELMRGAGSAWHKGCFTCQACKKKLDSTTLCNREGEIYCKSCYGRHFGPKGVGYGLGAGTLQTN